PSAYALLHCSNDGDSPGASPLPCQIPREKLSSVPVPRPSSDTEDLATPEALPALSGYVPRCSSSGFLPVPGLLPVFFRQYQIPAGQKTAPPAVYAEHPL